MSTLSTVSDTFEIRLYELSKLATLGRVRFDARPKHSSPVMVASTRTQSPVPYATVVLSVGGGEEERSSLVRLSDIYEAVGASESLTLLMGRKGRQSVRGQLSPCVRDRETDTVQLLRVT